MVETLEARLLRRYEPVIRFTRGEQFFPMGVDDYVRACSLWSQAPKQQPELLVAEGELDLARLATQVYDKGASTYFLKFIEPLNVREMAAEKLAGNEPATERFHAGPGRLVRVGYVSRLADAGFRLALLARGRVPGDTAAAAAQAYRAIMHAAPDYRYHGRVIRHDKWIVLQYWFFFAYNNWRSRFAGANDHEADWEMICLYLAEQPGQDQGTHTLDSYRPEWVAYASHDYHGDDLRRRWDDPEVQKIGDHPVIFAGAGSHASYFSPGEYLTELELPLTTPLVRISGAAQTFWRDTLRQYTGEDTGGSFDRYRSIFRIPFVDYARGDGLAIGPGQDAEWSDPILLNPVPPWVSDYRGLWGLYTRDPFSGEDAPAGPMYNRDATIRVAWYDPVGWAGLEKVSPSIQTVRLARAEQDHRRGRQNELRNRIGELSTEVNSLGVQHAATREQLYLAQLHAELAQKIDALSVELRTARNEYADNQALIGALDRYVARVESGDRGPLRAHIIHAHKPTDPEMGTRRSRLADFWAATSVGLMLLAVVLLGYFLPGYLAGGLVALVAAFAFIEAGIRGRFPQLVTTVTLGLTTAAAIVLLVQFFWELVVLLVLLAGLYILVDNVRELFE